MKVVAFPCPPSFTSPSYPKDFASATALLPLENRRTPLHLSPSHSECKPTACARLQHLQPLGVWEEGRSITKLSKRSTWQAFGIMSYSVWTSPLLCFLVAVTLASKIWLTLVYCETLFNVCIHPPSDQTMIPNTLPSSLPHFKLRV